MPCSDCDVVCSLNQEIAGVRIYKVLITAVAAAVANFFWYSVLHAGSPAISVSRDNVLTMFTLGFFLAVPLDELLKSVTLSSELEVFWYM